MSDLFTIEMLCSGRIAKNSKMVISPLGATKSRGDEGSFENFSAIHLTKMMDNTIPVAQISIRDKST